MFRLVLLSAILFCGYVNCVQVCDDCKYYVKPNKEHCHDNPDGERNMTEILKNWPDVTVEEYDIFTEDGYQLLIVRAYGKLEKDPIVLGHGIFRTPLGWINRGQKSLAHYVIEKGHDVWIINFRSSEYSTGHKNLTIQDNAYWDFSFHEFGKYDVDSALKLVKDKTSKKAIYIGYSVGTTAGYVYSSIKAKDAETTLKGMISLAPIAYLHGMKSYLRFLLPLAEYFRPLIYQRFHGQLPINKELVNCSSLFDLYAEEVKEVPLYGDDFSEIDDEYLPIKKLQNKPHYVGVDILVHLSQILRSKKFQERSFGKDKNLKLYGQENPPPYRVSDISVPQAFFVGNNDWVSTTVNDRAFYGQIDSSAQCGFTVIDHQKWNHNDFIEAKDIVGLLYEPLYEVIEKMSLERCNA